MLDRDELEKEFMTDMMAWHTELQRNTAKVPPRAEESVQTTSFIKERVKKEAPNPKIIDSGANANFDSNAISP